MTAPLLKPSASDSLPGSAPSTARLVVSPSASPPCPAGEADCACARAPPRSGVVLAKAGCPRDFLRTGPDAARITAAPPCGEVPALAVARPAPSRRIPGGRASRVRRCASVRESDGPFAAAALLDHHGGHEQGALGDVLPERVDALDRQAVLQGAEEGDGEQGAADPALAALERAAAERGCGDGLEFQALAAGDGLAGAGTGGEQDARDGGDDADEGVDRDEVLVDVDA